MNTFTEHLSTLDRALEEQTHAELKNAREKIQELQSLVADLEKTVAWFKHKLEERDGTVQ